MGKGDRAEIVVSERYKVVRIDSLNWQVFEFREIKNKQRAGQKDWVALPRFYGKLTDALAGIARHGNSDACGSMTLDEAVRAIEKSNERLAREIEKAVSGMNGGER